MTGDRSISSVHARCLFLLCFWVIEMEIQDNKINDAKNQLSGKDVVIRLERIHNSMVILKNSVWDCVATFEEEEVDT